MCTDRSSTKLLDHSTEQLDVCEPSFRLFFFQKSSILQNIIKKLVLGEGITIFEVKKHQTTKYKLFCRKWDSKYSIQVFLSKIP